MSKTLDDLEEDCEQCKRLLEEHRLAHYACDNYRSLEMAERNMTNKAVQIFKVLPNLVAVARAAELLMKPCKLHNTKLRREANLIEALKKLNGSEDEAY